MPKRPRFRVVDTRMKIVSPCPYCDAPLDGATSFEGHRPSPGCFSVCLSCASLLQFDKKLRLIKVSADLIRKLEDEEPRFMNKMRQYQRIVRDLDRRAPWEKPTDKKTYYV